MPKSCTFPKSNLLVPGTTHVLARVVRLNVGNVHDNEAKVGHHLDPVLVEDGFAVVEPFDLEFRVVDRGEGTLKVGGVSIFETFQTLWK